MEALRSAGAPPITSPVSRSAAPCRSSPPEMLEPGVRWLDLRLPGLLGLKQSQTIVRKPRGRAHQLLMIAGGVTATCSRRWRGV